MRLTAKRERRIPGALGTLAFGMAVALALPAIAADQMTREFDFAPGGTVIVEASGAGVHVRGSRSSGAVVTIHSKGEDLEYWVIDLGMEGDTLRVTARRQRSLASLWRGHRGGLAIDIAVPRRTNVDLDTAGGSLQVTGIEGTVALETSGGSIRVEDVRGDVEAETSGGSIRAEQVHGAIHAETSGGSIRAADIDGPLDAETSGGSIRAVRVTGALHLETSGGSIEVEDAGADVKAETSGGSLTVSFAPGNAAGGDLATSAGSITILIDPSVGLDLDLAASAGKVTTDLPVESEGTRTSRHLVGRLGAGGRTLRARASAGSIRLQAHPGPGAGRTNQ